MRVATAAAAFGALMAALTATAVAQAPTVPKTGVFVPGESLGGVRLGMTRADVRSQWGSKLGVCRSCVRPTWYFNLKPFEPQGAGVEFRQGRVARVFTVWRPTGWRTDGGLVLGVQADELRAAFPSLRARSCERYTAYVGAGRKVPADVYYVFRGRLWGFALMRPSLSPCL
jgi:hypothetical protein